jgi:hypothetical protein
MWNNIQWFTNAFLLIVWIPDILVSYSDDFGDDDWFFSVMNSVW